MISNANNNNIIAGFDDERDDSLKIILEKAESINKGIFIYLNGYIDTYNSNFFQKKVSKIVEAGFINLVFNCSSGNRRVYRFSENAQAKGRRCCSS